MERYITGMGKVAAAARKISQELVVTREHAPAPEQVERARQMVASLTPEDEEDAVALDEVSETIFYLGMRR